MIAPPPNSDAAKPANDPERLLLKAVSEGKWAEAVRTQDDAPYQTVRAVFLRRLLSDMSQSTHSWERSGLRVRGVHIEGSLDLADWTAAQGCALPPLLLDKCVIPEMINISYSHLSRLSITNSRISQIFAEGVTIDGLFDFSGVEPCREPGKPEENCVAWIDARGARFGGDIIGRGAHLRAPQPRSPESIVPGTFRFALGLGKSVIAGRIFLTPGFQAIGGVSLGNCEVSGETWLRGAELSSGESYALNGQNADFRSGLMLDDGFAAKGPVWLLGAKMSTLQCGDSTFENQSADGVALALEASGAEIRGFVSLGGKKFKALGAVSFSNTKISGSMYCADATFDNHTDDGHGVALSLDNAEIGGNVNLSGEFNAKGAVSLASVKISRDLTLTDAQFHNQTADGAGIAIAVANAAIGGDVNLNGKNFKALGMVAVANSKVAGTLRCSDACLENIFKGSADSYSFYATNTEVGGDLLMVGSVFVGEVRMWGLHTGRDLDTQDAVFLSSEFALTASHLRVAGDLLLKGTKALGDIWVPHVDVGGNLEWNTLHFVKEYKHNDATLEASTPSRFTLTHARIGSSIKARELTSEVKLHVDLGDAHVVALDDVWPEGWGGAEALDEGLVSLNLDGFTYERVHFPSEESNWFDFIPRWLGRALGWVWAGPVRLLRGLYGKFVPPTEAPEQPAPPPSFLQRLAARCRNALTYLSWKSFSLKLHLDHSGKCFQHADARLEWLGLQGDLQGKKFLPQPYRHLARVLRNQGKPEAARQVGIRESWRAKGEPWNLPFKVPFGICFGFGLSPLRAGITLIVVFVLGWAGVRGALRAGTLSVTANPVASLVLKGGRPQMAIQNGDPALATTEVTCSDEIEPALYAVDVMLPVISLHQETVCDIKTDRRFLALRIAKFAYSALGKLFVALALITFSGVLKSRAQE